MGKKAFVLGFLASGLFTWAQAQAPRLPVAAHDQSSVGARGYFYVDGSYAGEPGREIMEGQAYVEVVAPKIGRWPLVKGIVAIEPSGPPFENTITGSGKARLWGPTDIPITYSPRVEKPEDLAIEPQPAQAADLFACWLQKGPARQLVNLAGIPVMMMAAEASYHIVYDHCTAQYLSQAGVKTEYVRLQDKGIHGNGHMVMLEKNNLDIARLIDEWLQVNVQ